ncbi:helix-turn-helix domain-containing protein [Hymenobacter lapidarius]|uniref:helix-turn-helix domain-containing protein n=1 Tax=Hymenobacter lapidarius TaxID=1908237 RepID=UPI001300DE95|nr:helix-turn-helix domain-containing protein [Hymenobacter lapidarius]
MEFLTQLECYIRWAAREEYELMTVEKAAAAAEADQNDQVLTVAQAAQLLGLCPQTVYEWAKAEKLQAFKVGRAVRFKRGHVLAALQQQTQPDGRRKYARRATGSPAKPATVVAGAGADS